MRELLEDLVHDYKFVGWEAVIKRIRRISNDRVLERKAQSLPIVFTGRPFSSGWVEGVIRIYHEENFRRPSKDQSGIIVVSGQTLYDNPRRVISQAKGCITNCSMGSHVGIITAEESFPGITVDTDDICGFAKENNLLGKRVILNGGSGKIYLVENK